MVFQGTSLDPRSALTVHKDISFNGIKKALDGVDVSVPVPEAPAVMTLPIHGKPVHKWGGKAFYSKPTKKWEVMEAYLTRSNRRSPKLVKSSNITKGVTKPSYFSIRKSTPEKGRESVETEANAGSFGSVKAPSPKRDRASMEDNDSSDYEDDYDEDEHEVLVEACRKRAMLVKSFEENEIESLAEKEALLLKSIEMDDDDFTYVPQESSPSKHKRDFIAQDEYLGNRAKRQRERKVLIERTRAQLEFLNDEDNEEYRCSMEKQYGHYYGRDIAPVNAIFGASILDKVGDLKTFPAAYHVVSLSPIGKAKGAKTKERFRFNRTIKPKAIETKERIRRSRIARAKSPSLKMRCRYRMIKNRFQQRSGTDNYWVIRDWMLNVPNDGPVASSDVDAGAGCSHANALDWDKLLGPKEATMSVTVDSDPNEAEHDRLADLEIVNADPFGPSLLEGEVDLKMIFGHFD